ncbi:DNA-binding protein HU [Salmonella enterica]|nr:HU family DNA-binding protein [Salmonella enterica subsp. enterica serovar Saintpaul]EEC1303374.1 DNA-binding protein HU [Salmonella enterica]
MTKAELIVTLAERHRISRAQALAIFNDIADLQVTDLVESGVVVLQNLGRLKVTKRNPRTGRNPKTGEAIHIPESYTVKFVVTKDLKERLNG